MIGVWMFSIGGGDGDDGQWHGERGVGEVEQQEDYEKLKLGWGHTRYK
jgi:hypothetical protein